MTASAGFRIVRTWDESQGVLSLLDRLEARIALLTTLGSQIGIPDGLVPDVREAAFLPDAPSVARAFDGLRGRLKNGRIGYRAVVARSIGSPPSRRPGSRGTLQSEGEDRIPHDNEAQNR